MDNHASGDVVVDVWAGIEPALREEALDTGINVPISLPHKRDYSIKALCIKVRKRTGYRGLA